MTSDELDAQVDALKKAGRFTEAANLCLQADRPGEASELYAAVWDWTAAIRVAEDAGLLALAYRHAVVAGEREALARLLTRLPDDPEQAQEAADEAERRGRLTDAAGLRRSLGALDAAAELYERAGEFVEAARCHERRGRLREAGRLYERRLAEDPEDGEAALRLGRILAHLGRPEHAARALQSAARHPAHRRHALALLVACFDALGTADAAADCLTRLRRVEPEAPPLVGAFLEQELGDARGLRARRSEEEALLAGRYRVVRTLGAGATGRVLLAHDVFYGRRVAVKVLSVDGGAQGRDAFARFEREARIAAALDHPHVVRVLEFDRRGPFLVMEYMAGGTLEERLDGRPPALSFVRRVAEAALGGLEAVHRRGVVHRDLKPANIFFDAAGDVKIGDFGVAHLRDLGVTLTGAMLGTLAYMAPEQMTGAARPDASTDLYAFGCVLYRLLTGALPFPGPDFVTQHLERAPEPVSRRRPSLGVRFDGLLARLLAKDPADRPRSVDDVRRALEAIDWSEPTDEVAESPSPDARTSNAPRRSSAPPSPERYTVLRVDGAVTLARDELLGRTVRIEPCDEARAAWLRRLAQADGPHLQAVLDLDVDAGRCVLEEPLGAPLHAIPISAEERARVRAQVRRAVEQLHAAGVTHGDVGPHTVRIAPGRAVLMVPATPSSATTHEDLAAVERL